MLTLDDMADGGASLFRALCTYHSTFITTLDLAGRCFTECPAPSLRRALEHMPALLKLDLSGEMSICQVVKELTRV